MPSVSNAGGSLTSAIVLTLLAWGVRWVRGELIRRKKEELARQQQRGTPGRFHAALSPASLRMLIETGAQPHIIFDIRPPDNAEPLPSELRGALHLPFDGITQALSSPSTWMELFQGMPFPERHFLLVFVGSTPEQQITAAAAAASLGFQWTLTLAGALSTFVSASSSQSRLNFINRDAVSLLLTAQAEAQQMMASPGRVIYVIDVRRSDERILYGAIKGTVHVPVDRLPSALALPPDEFAVLYRFTKPQAQDVIIMSCRTSTRAAWAAQIAQDAGFSKCFVHRQGVYGWRLDPAVKVYRGYRMFDPPPDPEKVAMEEMDAKAGYSELQVLGLSSYVSI